MTWWMKIFAKIILSRLPFGYGFWRRLSLFCHGAMDDPEYVLRNFDGHYLAAGRPGAGAGFRALELGPGDTLASVLIVRGLGGEFCWLVDAGDFARKEMGLYRNIAANLQKQGVSVPSLEGVEDVEAMLVQCRGRYLTNGLAGLRMIPDASLDFIWSQAVLEHVRKHEFLDTARELRRILKPNGACSHRIDLRDHLDAGLNNLRFSDGLWESAFFARSGFYTNRIGFREMLTCFEMAGFEFEVGRVDRWSTPPIARGAMDSHFQDRAEEDLCVSGFNIVLRPSHAEQ